MIFKALVCYAVAFLIPLVALFTLFKLSKGKTKFYPLHIVLGAISFFVVLLAMLGLFLFAFSEKSTVFMLSYMPEWIYKLSIALLFFGAVCLVRYFVLNSVYFSRDKEKKGTSFLVGFGISGGLAVSVYSLFTFIYVLVTSLTSPLVELTDESVLLFEDSTVISVFTPFESHILLSLFFAIYMCLMLINSKFMTQHSSLNYKWSHTLLMYLLTSLCEVTMLAVLVFSISASVLAVVITALILAVLSALCVKLLYKYKEELPYDSQFN